MIGRRQTQQDEDYVDRRTKSHGPRRMKSLRLCAGTWEEEDAKERIADALLKAAELPRAAMCNPPRAYSEAGLERKRLGRCVVRLDDASESLFDDRPSQSWVDELKFMMSVTELNRMERFFLRAWMLGWTHDEAKKRWIEQAGPDGKFKVVTVIRKAISRCFDNSGITFDAISKQSIYRKPMRKRDTHHNAICRHCSEPFILGFGDGAYCCTTCRFAHAIGD